MGLFSKALRVAPSRKNEVAVYCNIVHCFERMGKYSEALEFLGYAQDVDPQVLTEQRTRLEAVVLREREEQAQRQEGVSELRSEENDGVDEMRESLDN